MHQYSCKVIHTIVTMSDSEALIIILLVVITWQKQETDDSTEGLMYAGCVLHIHCKIMVALM